MAIIALVMWIITAFGGLFLLAIWLIEYDPDIQRAEATRLPIPVITGHVLLALAGLAAWILYIMTDAEKFAWLTLALLGGVVTLGLTMAVRWFGVYRTRELGQVVMARSGGPGLAAGAQIHSISVPPERHFPVPVVIAHGVFATATVTLVVITALGVAGS
jgi:hypothetical protein